MTTSSTAQTGRIQARRAARGSAMEYAARAGFTARGVIYLLVGVLALQIAFGDGGRQADRGGALAALADKPFGSVVLWALGIGSSAWPCGACPRWCSARSALTAVKPRNGCC